MNHPRHFILTASLLAFVALLPSQAAAQVCSSTLFLCDTFTEGGGGFTNLENHDPDVGDAGSWTFRAGTTLRIDNAGDYVYPQSASFTGYYTNSTSPASADYAVSVDMTIQASGTFPNAQVLG
ncbi:MAG TPA: hypothetical protein VM534_05410, partial [Thermoanaerobaculia bacterium]|nr:hypothetical protein [Thermoanaerobaculia bacterium]